MKTKVVQHVPAINLSIWHLTLDIHFTYATFEHRHENKSCSACPMDQHKHLTFDTWQMTLLDTWHFTYATFEHRHENKSCSLCPKDQHKYLEHLTHVASLIRFIVVSSLKMRKFSPLVNWTIFKDHLIRLSCISYEKRTVYKPKGGRRGCNDQLIFNGIIFHLTVNRSEMPIAFSKMN